MKKQSKKQKRIARLELQVAALIARVEVLEAANASRTVPHVPSQYVAPYIVGDNPMRPNVWC